MKYLGLDLGTKTLGLAVSDKNGKLSFPLKTLRYTDTNLLIEELISVIKENAIDEIVIGLPKNMNNTEGEASNRIYTFIDELEKKIQINVNYQDERLSSVTSNKFLINRNMRRDKRKKVVDTLAAQIILESFIDRRK